MPAGRNDKQPAGHWAACESHEYRRNGRPHFPIALIYTSSGVIAREYQSALSRMRLAKKAGIIRDFWGFDGSLRALLLACDDTLT
jgi:hypothetical protein